MARSCIICSSNSKLQLAAEMVLAGATDQAIADRLGGMSRMAVRRHRENHIIKPAQDSLAIVAKGSGPRQQRQQLAQAAAADAPSPAEYAEAALGLRAQVDRLRHIEERLERVAAKAEASGAPTVVATIAGQQLRGVEIGSKLAGAGGYAPVRQDGSGMNGPPVSITINFADRTEKIIAMSVPPTVEHDGGFYDTEPGTLYNGPGIIQDELTPAAAEDAPPRRRPFWQRKASGAN